MRTPVQEHMHRVRETQKAKVWTVWASLALCIALVVALTGCTTVQAKGNPYPNGQFQGNVGIRDEQIQEQCKELAVTLVAQALKNAKVKPTDQQVTTALENVYGDCLFMNGRTI